MQRLTLGDFELTAVSNGFYRLDGRTFFGVIRKVMWAKEVKADAARSCAHFPRRNTMPRRLVAARTPPARTRRDGRHLALVQLEIDYLQGSVSRPANSFSTSCLNCSGGHLSGIVRLGCTIEVLPVPSRDLR